MIPSDKVERKRYTHGISASRWSKARRLDRARAPNDPVSRWCWSPRRISRPGRLLRPRRTAGRALSPWDRWTCTKYDRLRLRGGSTRIGSRSGATTRTGENNSRPWAPGPCRRRCHCHQGGERREDTLFCWFTLACGIRKRGLLTYFRCNNNRANFCFRCTDCSFKVAS